jgi:hypothetical protein
MSFTGCLEQYSDSKPMSEKRVDKFLEEKKDQIEDDIDDWASIEMTVDMQQTINGESTSQKYTTILDTKSQTYSIDMSQLGEEFADFGIAYLKGDYCYFDMPEQGKIKVDMSSYMDLSAFIDFTSQIDNYLFVFEELDAEELAELEVELFVTKTDDDGELYRFEFSKEYYEYLLEEGPANDLVAMLGEEYADIAKNIKYENIDFEEYVITFEFDEDGALIEMTEIVDAAYEIDMTEIYTSMGITLEDLAAMGVPTTMSMAIKSEGSFRLIDDKIEIDDSEYKSIY